MDIAKAHFPSVRMLWLKQTAARGQHNDPPMLDDDDRDTSSPHPGNTNPFLITPLTTPAEAKKSIHEAFNELNLTLEDTTPHRIKVAYRIVRELARITKAVAQDELLGEALYPDPHARDYAACSEDGWLARRTLPPYLRRFGPIRQELKELLAKDNTIALLPCQRSLEAYCMIAQTIFDDMGIIRGSSRWPEYGELGWLGLNDPATIRQTFPSSAELTAFETIVTHEVIEKIVAGGTRETARWLDMEFGFTDDEQNCFIRMARSLAMKIVPTDIDADQKMMILRLEDLARRARENFRYRDELMVLKQLAAVQGITRMESSDTDSQITTIIREFSRSGTPRQMAPVPPHIQIPPPAKVIESKVLTG